uniref:NADH-ubiquinone oxidoreductase chain 3 n=1 Tax=Stenus clavicornis TaxID=1202167 RepID=A0A191ZS18_9COLE|nr:NADH dehydrogenase subunit 3 [Stenus clavicornis]
MIIMMSLISVITLMISLLIMLICSLISKKSFMDREKNSPFECGFDPFSKSRIPFSLQFFLIAIIFLIFDIEITLLIPMIFMFKYINFWMMLYLIIIFIIILLIGLYHEWSQGALNWKI